MTRYPDFETGKPRAAVGKFPYPHPTLAEIAEMDRERVRKRGRQLDMWGRERQFRTNRKVAA